ncbi:MAG: hypothetical protein ABIZ95_12815, partial [Pyrinomonadaceae bacterium]
GELVKLAGLNSPGSDHRSRNQSGTSADNTGSTLVAEADPGLRQCPIAGDPVFLPPQLFVRGAAAVLLRAFHIPHLRLKKLYFPVKVLLARNCSDE